MRIDVRETPEDLVAADVAGAHIVVIDVLRASSTIVQACENGAGAIIPVPEARQAVSVARSLERSKVLLGGERGGRKIEGFDLGNSPLEYRREIVEGKTLVFTTSNGTRAIARSAGAKRVWIGCLRNLDAVVNRLVAERATKILALCAGEEGRRSLEDFACAGMLTARLADAAGDEVVAGETAAEALASGRKAATAGDVVESSPHGQRLIRMGFGDDVEFCARVGVSSTIPVLVERRIVAPV